jgi:hypothetical protein
MAWSDGVLERASIRSRLGNPLVIRTAGHERLLQTRRGQVLQFKKDLDI